MPKRLSDGRWDHWFELIWLAPAFGVDVISCDADVCRMACARGQADVPLCEADPVAPSEAMREDALAAQERGRQLDWLLWGPAGL